ncbi:MAG: hypothetical protein V4793_13665 [Paraburkholderia tropica]|uniref:hypothetical protein n=1 Tax=Burkholderia gladioli TaxID=28095 RepID=UPI000F0AFAD1|nr:hypothetical protein [Burkholderia gladioli]AYQ91524.1 hypothetical protein EDD84_30005 [Burkholderia gladioli]
MANLTELMSELAVNKPLQQALSQIEPDPNAYHMFFKLKGYACTHAEVESVFKDMVWFARVGDDIDHA